LVELAVVWVSWKTRFVVQKKIGEFSNSGVFFEFCDKTGKSGQKPFDFGGFCRENGILIPRLS